VQIKFLPKLPAPRKRFSGPDLQGVLLSRDSARFIGRPLSCTATYDASCSAVLSPALILLCRFTQKKVTGFCSLNIPFLLSFSLARYVVYFLKLLTLRSNCCGYACNMAGTTNSNSTSGRMVTTPAKQQIITPCYKSSVVIQESASTLI
jgi:hypothetical protein